MNPHYLWLTEGLELLTLFVIAPVVALVMGYEAWRKREQQAGPKHYGTRCVAFATVGILLFAFARQIDLDFRSLKYILHLTCVLLSFLCFGVSQGHFFSVLFALWRRHNETRLRP